MISNFYLILVVVCLAKVNGNPLNRYLLNTMTRGMDPVSRALMTSSFGAEMLDMDMGAGQRSHSPYGGYGGFGGYGSYGGYGGYGAADGPDAPPGGSYGSYGSFGPYSPFMGGPFGSYGQGMYGSGPSAYGPSSYDFANSNTVSDPKGQTPSTSAVQPQNPVIGPASTGGSNSFHTTNQVQPASGSPGNPYSGDMNANQPLLTSQSATIGSGIGGGNLFGAGGTGNIGGTGAQATSPPVVPQTNSAMDFFRNLLMMRVFGFELF